MMKNKVENEMFDEFDFMYHHKELVKKREEERIKAEEEKKAAEEAAKAAEKAALLNEEEKKKKPDGKSKEEKKKAELNRKKEEQRRKKQKEEQLRKREERIKKEKKEEEKRKKAARPAKEKEENAQKEPEKKIHPKYGKPYKNDRNADRKRSEIKEKPKKERKAKDEVKERRFSAETSAAVKAVFTRVMIYALISAGVATLLVGAGIAGAHLILGFHRNVSHKSVSYQVGLVSDTVRVPYDTVVRDGAVYVCGNDIVNLCGFTVTGTEDEIKYVSPDDGNDTVVFGKNSNRATVNKNEIRLEAPTFTSDGKLYIPVSFFTSYATGMVFEFTEETEDKRASLVVYKKILNEYDHKITGAAPVYEPVTFRVKEAVLLEKIDENALADEIEDATYPVDISAYYDAINPENLYAYISVINQTHRAVRTLEYDDLTKTVIQAESVEEPVVIRRIAARALEAMFSDVRGVVGYQRFNVYSGYHTYENSEESDPALDESLLGLSVEVYLSPKSDYGDTRTFKWFEENAYKYGFIIRYPKGKKDYTGVGFRPWVLRYVGRYAATKMFNEGLCLEEFIEKYNLERVLEIKRTDV